MSGAGTLHDLRIPKFAAGFFPTGIAKTNRGKIHTTVLLKLRVFRKNNIIVIVVIIIMCSEK
jgi:hypothetical protein